MKPTEPPDRPRQRIPVVLPADTFDALIAAAGREERPTSIQAGYLIRWALWERGYLDVAIPVVAETSGDFYARRPKRGKP